MELGSRPAENHKAGARHREGRSGEKPAA